MDELTIPFRHLERGTKYDQIEVSFKPVLYSMNQVGRT